jgi:hypothetical protein
MKSINLFKITACLAVALMVSGIKITDPQKSDTIQVKAKDYSIKFTELFTDPERLQTPCDCDKNQVLTQTLIDNELIPKDPENNNPLWSLPRKKKNIWVKKMIGWDASSYLFDFLDPLLQNHITTEFEKIYKEAQAMKPDPSYQDPYTVERMANPAGDSASINTEDAIKKVSKLISGFSHEKWETFISTAKLSMLLKEWNYEIDQMSQDLPKFIIDTYDYNGDGRLDPSEFILFAILHNQKKRNELSPCKNCFVEEIKKFLDPMYSYIDCDGDNTINAEEIWSGLKGLNRRDGDKQYNMYQCIIDGTEVRTVAINDFILKAQKTFPGKLTRDEWRNGILIGYWGRQIKGDKIFAAVTKNDKTKSQAELDLHNLKTLRWLSNGMKDISCDYLKNHK